MTERSPAMTSHRPYLLRALYEWIADNGMTPHILVDARLPGVRVPAHTVKDGRVVLNIADRAVAKLEMDDDSVRFSARFGGVSQAVMVPIPAVLAIYARETGQGMALPEDIVGSTEDGMHDDADTDERPALEAIDGQGPDEPPDDGGPPPEPRRAHLRVVK
ncbi:ClpXP protease specificity-enhancing factor [Luteimonas deserti]|uniref:ClpXP protease specificity-enhancing factor n=1 Tax=Luteimonas deserti TaxID=2752306 RepID=A0A7Z0QTY1_9GAMM|nr:ClpXP protease specificity-enhancing factor [Luteimonas deserti]NYZ63720.1 ClpXP protease specificity-enhancing factor [Luteimonas deserti]